MPRAEGQPNYQENWESNPKLKRLMGVLAQKELQNDIHLYGSIKDRPIKKIVNMPGSACNGPFYFHDTLMIAPVNQEYNVDRLNQFSEELQENLKEIEGDGVEVRLRKAKKSEEHGDQLELGGIWVIHPITGSVNVHIDIFPDQESARLAHALKARKNEGVEGADTRFKTKKTLIEVLDEGDIDKNVPAKIRKIQEIDTSVVTIPQEKSH